MNGPSIVVIKLAGELDLERRDEIRDTLTMPPSATAILLDFSDVTYADSTALAELLRVRSEAEAKNVPIAIVSGTTNPQLERLLAYSGLGDAFALYADRGAALTYLSSAVQ